MSFFFFFLTRFSIFFFFGGYGGWWWYGEGKDEGGERWDAFPPPCHVFLARTEMLLDIDCCIRLRLVPSELQVVALFALKPPQGRAALSGNA